MPSDLNLDSPLIPERKSVSHGGGNTDIWLTLNLKSGKKQIHFIFDSNVDTVDNVTQELVTELDLEERHIPSISREISRLIAESESAEGVVVTKGQSDSPGKVKEKPKNPQVDLL